MKLYKEIISGQKENYFKSLKNNITEEISPELKDLFFKMVSYIPKNRPSIQDILSHEWFKSYLELNDNQKEQLNKEIINDFENRKKIIDKSVKAEIEKNNKESDLLNTKALDNAIKYFKYDMKPIKAYKGLDDYFGIKIKGLTNPSKFMNKFCYKLSKTFEGNCEFEVDKNKLKFTATFEDENENEITIKFKLYESEEGLLLKLFKVEGSAKNFFDKFKEISEMLKNV